MQKYLIAALVFVFPALVSAHVTVKPPEVGVGAWQTFNVSVPVEKDMATIGVRLVIPEALEYVTPNVKPGWTVETIKEGSGHEAVVKEIIWKGGTIPAGMRDDFFFSAHVPAEEGTLQWKAYQTYADGSVVAWDVAEADQPKDANGEEDFSTKGPYSETKVINDLKVDTEVVAPVVPPMDKPRHSRGKTDCWTILALIMSGSALALSIRNTMPKIQFKNPTP